MVECYTLHCPNWFNFRTGNTLSVFLEKTLTTQFCQVVCYPSMQYFHITCKSNLGNLSFKYINLKLLIYHRFDTLEFLNFVFLGQMKKFHNCGEVLTGLFGIMIGFHAFQSLLISKKLLEEPALSVENVIEFIKKNKKVKQSLVEERSCCDLFFFQLRSPR